MQLARFVTFTLLPHPNADRLSIAKIDGTDWQCVTETSQWGKERQGVYIAIDALLDPRVPAFAFLKDKATKAFADGRPGHRLKTVRLRGALSQGLLIPLPDKIPVTPVPRLDGLEPRGSSFPQEIDWTAALKIERYEPPIPVGLAGDMIRCPGAFERYTSIENAKNFPDVFTPADRVRVTEKIHGTNFRVGVVDSGEVCADGSPHLQYIVGTHSTARATDGTNLYSVQARKCFPEPRLYALAKFFEAKRQFIVFAEIFGHKVQDLKYGCATGEQKVRVFDVLIDGQYQPFDVVQAVANHFEVPTVPVLYRGPFDKVIVLGHRDGPSTVPGAGHVREGVVVTSEPEVYVCPDADPNGFTGRKILKYISDAYLERKDAKDGH